MPQWLRYIVGSSPRMRGTLAKRPQPAPGAGIIPAHAGNTVASMLFLSRAGDHPRACGEHYVVFVPYNLYRGSSPRMRGTPGARHPLRHHAGIIPAHAGNTCKSPCVPWSRRDHPRACGEHGIVHSRYGRCAGIIPAHAGNTACNRPPPLSRQDHPRACGEHPSCRSFPCLTRGSSPRMRGTPVIGNSIQPALGIIPAHAGNTWGSTAVFGTAWDHPRACGEHGVHFVLSFLVWGSSPRMRGTLTIQRPQFASLGIIPAHAGNTVWKSPRNPLNGDHPRACGEHTNV